MSRPRDATLVAPKRALLADLGPLARLFRHTRGVARPDRLYEYLAKSGTLAETSLYLNLGLWTDGVTTLDAASVALARRLADVAQLDATQRVLDVGCGFGEQDRLWLDERRAREIVGVNISAPQVRRARALTDPGGRAAARLTFVEASATQLPYPAESFDAVVGLEAAFHFDRRVDFLAESWRVLRPGGVLALADLVFDRTRTRNAFERALVEHVGCKFWQVPRANLVSAAAYRAQCEAQGFAVEHWESIVEHVYQPFRDYSRRRLAQPEVRARIHPLLRGLLGVSRAVMRNDRSIDYLMLRLRKPAATA